MSLVARVAICAVLIGFSSSLRGQLAVYSFTGNTAAATSVATNLAASSLTGSNAASLSNGSPVYSAGSGSYYIVQSNWTGTAPGTTYFEFTLTPNPGYSASMSSIAFADRATSTGPTNYYLRSSADSYASNLKTGAITNDNTWYTTGAQSVSLTFTAATTFRIYANGASSAAGALRVDDVTINGSISAIPEPSTCAALAGGSALIGAILLRKRSKTDRSVLPP